MVYSSDRFRERSLHINFGAIVGLIGCIVIVLSSNNEVCYGISHAWMAGCFAGGPLIDVWLAGNTPWKGTRSVILGVNG
ncbi:hypothetical protein BFJ69_g15699 [Fusarium oxysporum]|uniref:Major facilitator superfamily (MFS) profile domain-containing protein n=1 Tax=Fusarium oxysporum TaxID=5507 RepID=A0A420MDE4_FUSOX|nr:hypothetical protein BFJ69_g15699 [Fusarium oxysporum]